MKKFLIIIAVVLSTTLLTLAKEWNGIIPLISTPADVIKLLGEPKHPNYSDLGERFAWEGGDVYINWTRSDCRDEENIIGRIPPPGLNVVVHQITVDPKSSLTLDDVRKIDPPKESLTPGGFIAGGMHHCFGSGGKWACSVSNTSGFGYSTNTESEVNRLYYVASDEEFAAWREKTTPCQSEKK